MHSPVTIVPFIPEHLEYMDIREEQEVSAQQVTQLYGSLSAYGVTMQEIAHENICWTAVSEDGILGCAGIVELWPTTYEAWAFFSKGRHKGTVAMARRIRDEIEKVKHGRVQAYIEDGFDDAERFIQWCGFEKEATLKKFTPDNKDNHLYVRFK